MVSGSTVRKSLVRLTGNCVFEDYTSSKDSVIPNGPCVRARLLQRANRPGGICSAAVRDIEDARTRISTAQDVQPPRKPSGRRSRFLARLTGLRNGTLPKR